MVRLGVIGLGQAAQILHFPNIIHMPDKFEITAVADMSPSLLEEVADKYHVKHRFSDGFELVKCEDVDAVMVLCAGDHSIYANAALEAGKHVFIEKPMTISNESLEKLLEVRRKHPDQVAMVGYCRRYNDSFLKMKELLQKDDRPISYVKARTIILEGPWYLNNTFHEIRAKDFDPVKRSEAWQKQVRDMRNALGGEASEGQVSCYTMLAFSGCHILSAVRELIGLPKDIRMVSVSPNGKQFTMLLEYDGFNMMFEEMNDQDVVDFDESIEIFQGTRKMTLRYDSPYIKYLPSSLKVLELEDGQSKLSEYGPEYRDMFANELVDFYDCIVNHRVSKCDVTDAAEDVRFYIELAKKAVVSTHQ